MRPASSNCECDTKFMQPALQHFFNNAVFPIYSGGNVINLMDYFSILKRGYALSTTITRYNKLKLLTQMMIP